jgi:DNA (cytosine-5)-methyltransferase 1
MRFLSLFSGIEAASQAWCPLGWECVAVAEIEPSPCRVLAHRYPGVPNLGDITKITQEQIESLGRIDVVVGGFPCQDLSIAGQRKGLKNADGTLTRSGLFFTACRIAEWAKPRWTIIENVPGLFSANEGRDFAAVARELAGSEIRLPGDGWRNSGVALGPRGLVEWTTLDAQYVRVESHPRAVPQRRRRVFIVRDSGDWANRPPLFLIPESMRRNTPPRREAGKRTAPTLAARTRGGGGLGTDFDCDGGLIPEVCGTLSDEAHNGGGLTGRTRTPDESSLLGGGERVSNEQVGEGERRTSGRRVPEPGPNEDGRFL